MHVIIYLKKIYRPLALKVNTYKTIILPISLYSCETWCLSLRQEQKLWAFMSNVMRKDIWRVQSNSGPSPLEQVLRKTHLKLNCHN